MQESRIALMIRNPILPGFHSDPCLCRRACETPAPEGPVWLRLRIEGRRFGFSWSADGEAWTAIGPDFATWRLSDEHSGYGEFTGTMVGLACVDAMLRSQCADFDFLDCEEL